MPIELGIVVSLGIIGLLLIFSSPYFGLLLFTAFLYLRPADFFPALTSAHFTRIIAGLTFLIMLFKQISARKPIFNNSLQTRLLIAFTVILLFSVTTSIWKGNSIEQFTNFLKIFISFILIVNLVDTMKKFNGIIWVMVLSGLFMGVNAVMDYSAGVNLVGSGRVRGAVGGMFNNPNDLALCFIMLIPYAYYLFLKSRAVFLKLLSVATIVIFLMGTVFTQSRGGAIGLLGLLLFVFLITRRKMMAAVALALFVFLFFSLAPTEYVERLRTIPTGHQEDPNTISRIDAWKAGISMMLERPLGVGIGNFGEGFVKYRPPGSIELPGMRRAAHNTFIQIGAEAGFPALLVFLLMIFSTFKNLNKVRKDLFASTTPEAKEIFHLSGATSISMVSFLITVLFLSQAYNWILYYFVAFSVVLSELARRQNYAQPC